MFFGRLYQVLEVEIFLLTKDLKLIILSAARTFQKLKHNENFKTHQKVFKNRSHLKVAIQRGVFVLSPKVVIHSGSSVDIEL